MSVCVDDILVVVVVEFVVAVGTMLYVACIVIMIRSVPALR